MTNEEINAKRHSLTHNQLKNVLIRIDYTGITNIDNWVEAFKPKMTGYFSAYNRGVQNNARVNLTNLKEIADTLSIPIEEIRKETIHEFSGWKLDENTVTMSISPFFMTINIRCNNYKVIDPFLDVTSLFLQEMYEREAYFDVHRVGIRKVDGGTFDSIDDIFMVYKKELFFGQEVDAVNSVPLNREYTYRYCLKDSSMKVNYSRQYRLLDILNVGKKHQVLLDIDTYIDKYNMNECHYDLKESCKAVLEKINNHQFELFAESVNEDYINQNKHDE